MQHPEIEDRALDALHSRLDREAEEGGYHLNPDVEFTRGLVWSLMVNEKRYGYPACPCRLATGTQQGDLDIICPCDYRDPDLDEFGSCYCALYVSADIAEGRKQPGSIPERRPPEEERKKDQEAASRADYQPAPLSPPLPVWRCSVCGYLCARDGPPEVCPICKAKRERFSRFL